MPQVLGALILRRIRYLLVLQIKHLAWLVLALVAFVNPRAMLNDLPCWQPQIRQVKLADKLKFHKLRIFTCHAVDVPRFITTAKSCGRVRRWVCAT